jgi:predicted NBD/HSP70 family sugar kinase
MADKNDSHAVTSHGAAMLPAVRVDTYNAELRDAGGFLGDRASKGAFNDILDDWRERLRRVDADPFGETPTAEISRKELDKVLRSDDLEASALLHTAIDEFAGEFATVIRRFLRSKGWKDTERIVVGGGFKESRIGELAVSRAAVLLKADGINVDLVFIRHHPNEAGLIGAAHLAPAWVFSGHDGILAVDIGGTNIRAGVVDLARKNDAGPADYSVWRSELWRHADDKPKRDEAIERLLGMLRDLAARAGKEKLALAPFIGIGCPGIIKEGGSIQRGGQNLPGNWESSRFNLADSIRAAIPELGGHPTTIVIHNDAVVQGLSQLPFMQDVERWGVLTIGTGLGNARFTNLPSKDSRADDR